MIILIRQYHHKNWNFRNIFDNSLEECSKHMINMLYAIIRIDLNEKLLIKSTKHEIWKDIAK